MKNNYFLKIVATGIFITACGLIYFSCQKDKEILESTPSNAFLKSMNELKAQGHIKKKGDVIYFSSMEIADSICHTLNNLSREEFRQWEKANGFLSLKTVFDICLAEMDSAKTREEYDHVLEKYADILSISDNSVKPGSLRFRRCSKESPCISEALFISFSLRAKT